MHDRQNQFSAQRQVPLNRQNQFSQPKVLQPKTVPPINQNVPVVSAQRRRFNIEKVGYYAFLVTIVLAMFAFIPSPYLSFDVAKTFVIVMGTLVSAVCYGIVALKERKIVLPPKKFLWTGILLILSLLVSSLISIHIGRSLFGQGFEVGTAGFITALFLLVLISFETMRRDNRRVRTVYSLVLLVFAILVVFHGLRLIFGPSFLSLSVINTAVSTVIGKWNELAIISLTVLIVVVSAMSLLTIKGRARIILGVTGIVSFFFAFLVNQSVAWLAAAVALVLVAVALWQAANPKAGVNRLKSCLARTPWLIVVVALIAVILAFTGARLARPLIQATNTQYAELALPWQMTIDVVAGTVKNYPWFGIGPNHFAEAFMAYKPLGFNLSDAWNVEFNSSFGFVPTLFAAQGGIGIALWILFLTFIGIGSTRLLGRLPEDPEKRFVAISLFGVTSFLWIIAMLYSPSHAVLMLTFVSTGALVAIMVANESSRAYEIAPAGGKARNIFMPIALIILILIAVLWGVIQTKKTAALAYFASGIKSINTSQDFSAAQKAFGKAISLDGSDVYWQALAESYRLEANQLVASSAVPSNEAVAKFGKLINDGIDAARKAIAYNPTNYYNYVSEARVSALAAQFKVANAYDNAVRAYVNATRLNPTNPSLYINLAQTEVAEGKFDDALKSIGAALQIKNNYLDAVFLLSQVQAAQGNLKDAITSAQVAIGLNPQNPLLYFQLGLLEYNNKSYDVAVQAFGKAVELAPDYANARYFLGLAAARLGDSATAINQFEELVKSNPDNQEILFILSNLRAGKSPFANATPPVTPTPEKRSSLPVKEK